MTFHLSPWTLELEKISLTPLCQATKACQSICQWEGAAAGDRFLVESRRYSVCAITQTRQVNKIIESAAPLLTHVFVREPFLVTLVSVSARHSQSSAGCMRMSLNGFSRTHGYQLFVCSRKLLPSHFCFCSRYLEKKKD